MRKIVLLLFLALATVAAHAQRPACGSGNINASYNDNVNYIQYLCTTAGWKANAGIGAPTVGYGPACYGNQYVDVQADQAYVCGVSGWVSSGGGGGGPFLPLAGGGPITGPVSIAGTAVNANGGCPTASALGFALNGTDETAKLLAIWTANQAAGVNDCIFVDSGKSLTIGSTLTVPNATDVGSTGCPNCPVQVAHRLTGAGANGSYNTLPAGGTSAVVFTGNNSPANLITLGSGSLEIDHLALQNTTTCGAFVFTTNTIVKIHDDTFDGSAAGTSACNDGVVMGGTTTAHGSVVADAFFGYGSFVHHNFFHQMRTAVKLQVYAQGIPVTNNTIDQSDGGTSSVGAFMLGTGVGTTNGNTFSGNLLETSNYPYPYYFAATAAHNTVVEDSFWDATATTLFLFHFVSGASGNTGYVSTDGSAGSAKLADNNVPLGPNAVIDAVGQTGIVLAAYNGRYCHDTSGSGTAQSCSTSAAGVPFTPALGSWILYATTTANTGAALTINVNGAGAASVLKWQNTSTLVPGDVCANEPIPMFYDGTHWVMPSPCIRPNTGGTCTMSTSTSCTVTVAATYGTPVCIATQQSGTLTGGAVGCTVSGNTATITAAVANSETWGALVFGNPN